MSSYEEQQLKKLEAALSALTPRPVQLNRDGLLFEAGRRSVGPPWLWRGAAAGMTIVAGFLVFTAAIRPQPEHVIQYVHVPATPAAPLQATQPEPPPDVTMVAVDGEAMLPAGSYWRMQQAALRDGVDRLPLRGADGDAADTQPWPAQPIPSVGARDMATTLLLTGDR